MNPDRHRSAAQAHRRLAKIHLDLAEREFTRAFFLELQEDLARIWGAAIADTLSPLRLDAEGPRRK